MVKEKYIIGIDPGINGGISVLDRNNNIVFKSVMPVIGTSRKEYDIINIYNILNKYKNSICYLEKAQPRFKDGSKQAFKTGFGFGVLQSILVCLKIPHEIISPKQWQKEIFKGLDSKDTKKASVLFCKRRWIEEDWTPTQRAKKEHDGITDATCIAYYGARLW